jgi:hypothetical protein
MMHWLLGFSVLILSQAVNACDVVDNNALNSFTNEINSSVESQRGVDVDFGFLLPICKPWPQKAGLNIIAKPYVYTNKIDNSERYLGVMVAIVDKYTGAILGKADERKLMSVDAMEPSEIDIDTANYKIDGSEPAFGIRVTRRNHSSVNPFSEQVMNLYLLKMGGLKDIANRLLTATYSGEGDGRCKFSGVGTTVFINAGKSKSNGYSDLIARVKTIPIRYAATGGVCHKIEAASATHDYVLQFDGKSYRIPKPLQASLD